MTDSNSWHWDQLQEQQQQRALTRDELRYLMGLITNSGTMRRLPMPPTTLWGYAVGDGVKIRRQKESPWEPGTVVRFSPNRTVWVSLVGGEVIEVKIPMLITAYVAPSTLEDVERFLQS